MPMDRMSDIIRAIIEQGGMASIDQWKGGGLTDRQIYERLKERYGQLFTPQQFGPIAQALLARWQAARAAGDTLNRRRSDRPLSDSEHVGGICGPKTYQYRVVIRIYDEDEDRSFSRPLAIDSDEPLGKQSIIDAALEQIPAMLAKMMHDSPDAIGQNLTVIGRPRITEALKCI